MILSDKDIVAELGKELKIIPHPAESNIQPCSVDLHLGDELKSINGKSYDILHDTYKLKPNEFLLGCTNEYIEIPPHLCGQVEGKSSIARLGISCHQTAGYIDAGYNGNITLELYNCSDKPFELSSGMPICQIIFHPLTSIPIRNYGDPELNSHYQGSNGVVLSKFGEDNGLD